MVRREDLLLQPQDLYRTLDPNLLPFTTTDELEPLEGTLGQPRALEALQFGLEVKNPGYHIFVAGQPGSGRESTVLRLVEAMAKNLPTPPDWVYVHNFEDPQAPIALSLPPGRGKALKDDMEAFIDHLKEAIPRAFESEDYENKRRKLLDELDRRRQQLWEKVNQSALQRSFALQVTPSGVLTIPLFNQRPLTAEELSSLSEEARRDLEEKNREIQEEIAQTMREIRRLERQWGEKLSSLDQEVALFALRGSFEELLEKYQDLPAVEAHLKKVQEDILENLGAFFPKDPSRDGASSLEKDPLFRYQVNVIVDHSQTQGAPIVLERNPTFPNLMGRMEYRQVLGALVTDFRQIRAGALHRANGGFLILHTVEVLQNPLSWEALKRALLTRKLEVENFGQGWSAYPTATLRPHPIPLDVKVILLGTPWQYYILSTYDEDFPELFGVRADFAPDMPWNDEHIQGYARFLRRISEEKGLLPFSREAVARVVEYGARQVGDQKKLSSRFLWISHLAVEASFWAQKRGSQVVRREDVEEAIRKRIYRSNMVAERYRQYIAEGVVKIDTRGRKVGQMNGLAVLELGDFAFGKPSRVTARISLGRGNLISIEREIALSGPIHTKGFLILSHYLMGTYAQNFPLALQASITFEQSYDEIEGDSASSVELFVLLSAISGVPLAQGIAATGAVNQYGEIQAIGGVNEKIEGFFAVCQDQGLTGEQGVIIPKANRAHLMLQKEVVDAVRQGKFHIWAVDTVDEAMEILTGLPAGTLQEDGTYPEGTLHHKVMEGLRSYAERAKAFSQGEEGKDAR
ncbi:MAG: AAA family ATPase [Clostridiales bacterium]|nr:AAA family ATPase [Clostridiales bacterium]